MIKKTFNWFIRFWKGIWAIIKSMGNWKGVTDNIYKLNDDGSSTKLAVSDEKENEGD